jgi:V/A-type H+/Na+-transporting ATPase subunit I
VLSPVAMKRLNAVVLDRDARPVLRQLGRMGVMHLLRTEAGPDTAPLAPPDRSAELAKAEALVGRLESLRERLGLAPYAPTVADACELPLSHAEDVLRPIEERINNLLSRRQDFESRLSQAQGLLTLVESYHSLDIPLDWVGESRFMHFAIGSLAPEQLQAVQSRLGANVVLMPMEPRAGRRPLVAVTTHADGPALDKMLSEAGFMPEEIPAKEGATTTTLTEDSREELTFLRHELAQVNGEVAAEAAASGETLERLWNQVSIERRILEAEQHFPRTEQTALVTGWVPAPDVPAVEAALQKTTEGCFALTVTDPDNVPEDEIPVLLRHSWLIRPFAALVTGYGLPRYREFSPTVLFAITFVLMFGIMFGDAGNGAVLLVGALYLLISGKTQSRRDAGLLVLLMSLSSIGFGIVFGSYFGFTLNPIWDVEKDPAQLMAAAIGMGIAMMSVGLVLNVINRLRHGDWMTGLLDKFGVAGALFYWGVLAAYLNVAGVNSLGMVAVGAIVLVPLVVIAIKEPLHVILSRRSGHKAHATLSEACMESLIEAFDAVLGYLSNTVSFVRIAAYSIAHAAVLKAAIGIAHDMGSDTTGLILGIVVIIIGNAIAIGLEGIVATVQAIRLEYYEFFGKFFSGVGRPFAPFRIEQGNVK